MSDLLTNKSIRTEHHTTEQILRWPHALQKALSRDLYDLLLAALLQMPEGERGVWATDVFKKPGGSFKRHAILLRDRAQRLIGASMFDCGPVLYEEKILKGIYMIFSVLLPQHQGQGIGKAVGAHVLKAFCPDMLFSSCTQSPMLHSRVGLCQKGLVTGYDVYPRLERQNEREVLVTLPYHKLDLVIDVFRQVYLGVVDGEESCVNAAMNNLTVRLVRKNMTGLRFDFNPWCKDGREDRLAGALGLEKNDGVLVTFIKKS